MPSVQSVQLSGAGTGFREQMVHDGSSCRLSLLTTTASARDFVQTRNWRVMKMVREEPTEDIGRKIGIVKLGKAAGKVRPMWLET